MHSFFGISTFIPDFILNKLNQRPNVTITWMEQMGVHKTRVSIS